MKMELIHVLHTSNSKVEKINVSSTKWLALNQFLCRDPVSPPWKGWMAIETLVLFQRPHKT